MAEESLEEQRKRLLQEVTDIQKRYEDLQQRKMMFINPTTTSFSYKILEAEVNRRESSADAFFETKVWYPDGRIEVVRGYTKTGIQLSDTTGKQINLSKGSMRKIEEGFRVSFQGLVAAWKRGPDGRPVPSKPPPKSK